MILLIIITVTSRTTLATINPDYQWNLQDVGVEEAWLYTQGRPEITVAIIDSGVDFNHPDLINQSWINLDEIPDNDLDDDQNGYIDDIIGWDFRDNDNDPSPGHYHGTFIAGLIAADDDDDISVGIAPNVKLMAIRFLKDDLTFSVFEWSLFIAAIDYAIENGANIINLSMQTLGTPPDSFYKAIKRAYENNVVVVSVTGNIKNSSNTVQYPGNYSEVIAVSAITRTKEIADFSCFGDQNEICAPGELVYSIEPNSNELYQGSGTSYSAPLVSGAVALILSLNNGLKIQDIREILHETAIDLGEKDKDPIFGYGLLNVSAALKRTIYEYNNGTIVIINSISTSKDIITDSTSLQDLFIITFIALFFHKIMRQKTK